MADQNQELQLGQLLQRKRLITTKDLQEALEEQIRGQAMGRRRPLGAIFVDKGILTNEQLALSLAPLRKDVPSRLGKYSLVWELGRGGRGVRS